MTEVDASRAQWSLKSFIDSLTLELDRVRDTLAVKSVNRRLTYTVKDLQLELELFPDFDGQELLWTTARSGETGAARISFQLGSITDRQIMESSADPSRLDDVKIEGVEGIDGKTRKELEKIGVTTLRDMERVERSNIDISTVGDPAVDYKKLAQMIQRSRRRSNAPTIRSASLADHEGSPVIEILGANLATSDTTGRYPRAFLNDEEIEVLAADDTGVRLAVDTGRLAASATASVHLILDPYAIVRMTLAE